MARVDRDGLVRYLNELLCSSEGIDYCPNGLQVEGRREIRKLVTGVSACRRLFAAARERGADAVLVHHGIFWKGDPQELVGFRYHRVRELILGELNLIAYHLPLDRHSDLGNNALAARDFGLSDLSPFALVGGQPTGFQGRFASPITSGELVRRTTDIFHRQPLVFEFGPKSVETMALVSGAAQRELYSAIDAGLDAFLTGEVSEWVMNVAQEAGIHYLAAGHYATERLGVRALGEHIAERFGIEVEFIEIENPV